MIKIKVKAKIKEFDLFAENQSVGIEQHLRDRGVDPNRTHLIVDKKTNVATFLLFNFSGQLVGFQRYNPKGSKGGNNPSDLIKYYTYITSQGKEKNIAVWGLDTLSDKKSYVFVTEGVFDIAKVHNSGEPGIAVLSNNPKSLKSFLKALGKTVIAIADNDDAGSKIESIASIVFKVPTPYKDLGEMPQEEATKFIKDVLSKER